MVLFEKLNIRFGFVDFYYLFQLHFLEIVTKSQKTKNVVPASVGLTINPA